MEKMENISSSRSVSRPQFSATRERSKGNELERNGNNGELYVQKTDFDLDQTRNKRLLKLSSISSSRHGDTDEYLGVQKKDSDLDKGGPSRNEDEPLSQNEELGLENADLGLEQMGKKSHLKLIRRKSSKFDDELSSRAKASEWKPPKRRHGKSPYKPPGNDTMFKNVGPFPKNEGHRHLSPHEHVIKGPDLVTNEKIGSKRLENHQADIVKDKIKGCEKSNEASNAREKSNYIHRSQSAPRSRYAHTEENEPRTGSPLRRIKKREANCRHTSSIGKLSDMAANATISRAPSNGATHIENTDSDSLGDIFFSKEYTAMKMELQNNDHMPHQLSKENANHIDSHRRNSSITVTTRTSMASNSSFNQQINDKISATTNSKLSGTSGSTVRLMENRKRRQGDQCCSCLWSLICGAESPEKFKEFDKKADFIEKAFVVETLSKFWSDKHQPTSLDGFTCHKQVAQSLKQLVSHATCPHILLKGPRGSGKKALSIALLCELFGKSALDISHELRCFHIKGNKPMQIVVPLTSSAHHFELNAYKEPNIKHALISLVKEISSNFATAPDVSLAIERTNYKVMVLYDVDKTTETIQHLIKWIMDCYTETCKLILCCEDDEGIIEPVKNRCKTVIINAPVTREIMEVLIQIAENEKFDLPTSFALKIAKKSRHNLRRAIMALEAFKAQNYPFVDDQPIPMGWDEVVNDLAAEIIADPSETRIFSIRGKFQKLLVEFVHPKMILQGLAEQFLRVVEGRSKRELYYWHAYIEKRLSTGTTALVKLEEFVSKFMSIYRIPTSIDDTISESRG